MQDFPNRSVSFAAGKQGVRPTVSTAPPIDLVLEKGIAASVDQLEKAQKCSEASDQTVSDIRR